MYWFGISLSSRALLGRLLGIYSTTSYHAERYLRKKLSTDTEEASESVRLESSGGNWGLSRLSKVEREAPETTNRSSVLHQAGERVFESSSHLLVDQGTWHL